MKKANERKTFREACFFSRGSSISFDCFIVNDKIIFMGNFNFFFLTLKS